MASGASRSAIAAVWLILSVPPSTAWKTGTQDRIVGDEAELLPAEHVAQGPGIAARQAVILVAGGDLAVLVDDEAHRAVAAVVDEDAADMAGAVQREGGRPVDARRAAGPVLGGGRRASN